MQNCKHCKTGNCIKAGLQSNGNQKWKCKICRKYQQASYLYQSYIVSNETVKSFVVEGVGLRSMGRLLGMSCTTIIKRIRAAAKHISPPTIFKANQVYEMDEMHTFIQRKDKSCWLSYAINRTTKQVVDFRLGSRTKRNLKQVVESVLYRHPKRIYTDGYNLYPALIPIKSTG